MLNISLSEKSNYQQQVVSHHT